MTFPVYFYIGPLTLHPHFVMETLAYFFGFRLYLYTRNRDKLPPNLAIWVVVGATLGAAIGSKLLFWFENPFMTLDRWNDANYLMGGKTIVGGLLGGLIGVEWVKKRVGITRSTGDDIAFPLITGIAIGRIGCFLTGLPDHTYGNPTSLPLGVDFGDGVPRHPTQLYEIIFLILLACFLLYLKNSTHTKFFALKEGFFLKEGALFQFFMIGYLLFRFSIDFIKPTIHPYAGLNNMQVACLAGLIYYAIKIRKTRKGFRGMSITHNQN